MGQDIRKSQSPQGIPYTDLGQVLLVFVLDAINSVCDCVYLYDSLILHFGMWWITLQQTGLSCWADDTNFLRTANWGKSLPPSSKV